MAAKAPGRAGPPTGKPAAGKPTMGKPGAGKPTMGKPGTMTEGQRAYEQRRAEKAGLSLDRWLEQKRRDEATEAAALARAQRAEAPKKKGFLSRLIDRAHKPLS